jgi:hypothetical protein
MSIRVLIVEDDYLIAIDISQQLAKAGFEIVGLAPSVTGSSKFVASCDVAVLNFILGNETSEPIARKLQAAGKPFVVLCCLGTVQMIYEYYSMARPSLRSLPFRPISWRPYARRLAPKPTSRRDHSDLLQF